MEEFKNMESDIFDMPNALDTFNASTGIRRHEDKAASQNMQIMRLLKAKSKKNWLKSAGMLKPTIRNVAKQF